MTEENEIKLSRRDALKVLGTVIGATALTGLTPEWTKPALAAGELPSQGRLSAAPHTLSCDVDDEDLESNVEKAPITVTSGVTITLATSGILMQYIVSFSSDDGSIISPNPLSGTATTNAAGYAKVDVEYKDFSNGDGFTVTWSFDDSDDGTGTCEQTFTVPSINP